MNVMIKKVPLILGVVHKPLCLISGTVTSKGSRSTSYVESADVHLEVQSTQRRPTAKSRTSTLFKSLGAKAREKADADRQLQTLSPVPQATPGRPYLNTCFIYNIL